MTRLTIVLLAAVAAVPALAGTAPSDSTKVVAYYFHRTLRCQTCLSIEALARYDVQIVLADRVASGKLEWRPVDFQAEGNAGFVEQFALEAPSLVIAEYAGDRLLRWVNLDRVWELVGETEAFDAYVLEGIGGFLDPPRAGE